MLPYPFKTINTQGHYQLAEPVTGEVIVKMANYLTGQKLKKGTNLSNPEKVFEQGLEQSSLTPLLCSWIIGW